MPHLNDFSDEQKEQIRGQIALMVSERMVHLEARVRRYAIISAVVVVCAVLGAVAGVYQRNSDIAHLGRKNALNNYNECVRINLGRKALVKFFIAIAAPHPGDPPRTPLQKQRTHEFVVLVHQDFPQITCTLATE